MKEIWGKPKMSLLSVNYYAKGVLNIVRHEDDFDMTLERNESSYPDSDPIFLKVDTLTLSQCVG